MHNPILFASSVDLVKSIDFNVRQFDINFSSSSHIRNRSKKGRMVFRSRNEFVPNCLDGGWKMGF